MLVTGATGLLGANFVAAAVAAGWRVVAVARRQEFRWPGVDTRRVDLREADNTMRLLGEVRPSVVVHLAAETNVDLCEERPAEAEAANAGLTALLARSAATVGAVFVYMSTDSVFDGRRGGYTETDMPAPVNEYARSKLAGEQAVRSAGVPHLIVRANIYGWNAQSKASLAEWVLGRLERRESMSGFVDVVFSPLLVNTLAGLMLGLLDREARGTIHLACSTPLTKHDFAVAIADTFGLSSSRITRASLTASALKAPRPLNTVLSCPRLEHEFSLRVPNIRDDLAMFRRLREDGFAMRLKDSLFPRS